MALLPALHKRFKYIPSPLTEQEFVPLDVIEKEVTEQSVEQTLKDSINEKFSYLVPWTWKKSIPDASLVVQKAKRIFAILAIIGEPLAIGDLLDEGITDGDLPLKRRSSDSDDDILLSCDGRKEFTSFADWKNDRRVTEFLERQRVVLAPVVDLTGKHIKLDPLCPLPFLSVEEVGHGISSAVYRAEVHLAHQDGLYIEDGKAEVAAKEFRNINAFKQEKENLDKILDIRHPHLIQHLATYERGRVYYVIFPWANGNLAEFWNEEQPRTRTKELVLWSLRQMVGISDAMKSLHYINCRHGDLKPENILLFRPNKGDTSLTLATLVVADVGISRLHKQMTRLRSEGTTTKSTTPAYEAPESEEKGPRARRYDMWSLGCILLEFVVWLLEDYEAVERFHASRDKPHFEFYRHQGTKQIVHPHVLRAMDFIKQDPRVKGGTALEELVQMIAGNLLLIDAESRDTAEEVVQKLRKIVETAERSAEYIWNRVDTTPARFDFQPRPTRKDSVSFESNADTIFEEPSELV